MNILIQFALAQYYHEATNMTAVNAMIGLGVVHLIFIVIYHIVTYSLSGVTKNKLQLHVNTLVGWITTKCNQYSTQQSRLDSDIKNKIQSAIYYKEYREPLIIQ